MTDTSASPEPERASVNLKLPPASVSADQPWNDDILDRQALAATLTNLIRTQSHPFTISIHGHWGTGKTFLLQRWQQDLETQGFQAIYFNAWEDDFCDDPLLAILGQLSEYFKTPRLQSLAAAAAAIAIPLLRQTALTIAKTTTGLSLDLNESRSPTLLDEYHDQRKTKDALKDHLGSLSCAVQDETACPLVFIIDELDRCRPTFAIELLENIKHIFDIPNIVFVFGINRSELSQSLRSVYGEINSDIYLRRFFDTEFTLPEIDAAAYCSHVMAKFGLQQYFSSRNADATTNIHAEEYRAFSETFPNIWSGLGLSLRDIEACVALIAIAGANLRTGNYMFPYILGLLIPIKLKNSQLYHGFVQHRRLASEVINYADGILSSHQFSKTDPRGFDFIEAYLYFAENTSLDTPQESPSALSQLSLLAEGKELSIQSTYRTGSRMLSGIEF